MSDSRVFARKYRPQNFSDVLGQDATVKTLKNAVKYKRLANAYLFSGPRGVGKTTLARLLAKALNCSALSDEQEPCNTCRSCKEIASGSSVIVLEIDGASNRGIEEVRRLNEVVSYGASKETYRVILIDEVHMLTKEAFNALLKTLEEPPPRVVFFFATTERNKVPPTILSRCQTFQLRRIGGDLIQKKLEKIAREHAIEVSPEALQLVAQRAGGGLRDAESMFDQLYAFCGEKITVESVCEAFGWVSADLYQKLDDAAMREEYSVAFEITEELYNEGKDLAAFLEGLADHYRAMTIRSLNPKNSTALTGHQAMDLLGSTLRMMERFHTLPSQRCALEAFLLEIMRMHKRPSVNQLLQRLESLESRLKANSPVIPQPSSEQPIPAPKSGPAPIEREALPARPSSPPPPPSPPSQSQSQPQHQPQHQPLSLPQPSPTTQQDYTDKIRRQGRYDTLMQFAAIELRGVISK